MRVAREKETAETEQHNDHARRDDRVERHALRDVAIAEDGRAHVLVVLANVRAQLFGAVQLQIGLLLRGRVGRVAADDGERDEIPVGRKQAAEKGASLEVVHGLLVRAGQRSG